MTQHTDTTPSEAEAPLADRRVFTLDAKGWDAFVAALDAPPRATRGSSDCFANLLCSIPQASGEAFASPPGRKRARRRAQKMILFPSWPGFVPAIHVFLNSAP